MDRAKYRVAKFKGALEGDAYSWFRSYCKPKLKVADKTVLVITEELRSQLCKAFPHNLSHQDKFRRIFEAKQMPGKSCTTFIYRIAELALEYNPSWESLRIIRHALNGLNPEIAKKYESSEHGEDILIPEFVQICAKIEKSLPETKLEPTIAAMIRKQMEGITSKLLNVSQQKQQTPYYDNKNRNYRDWKSNSHNNYRKPLSRNCSFCNLPHHDMRCWYNPRSSNYDAEKAARRAKRARDQNYQQPTQTVN